MKNIIIAIAIIIISINCKSINSNKKDFKETEKIKKESRETLERETKDYNNDFDDDRENQQNE
jgi:hypothetical protein